MDLEDSKIEFNEEMSLKERILQLEEVERVEKIKMKE